MVTNCLSASKNVGWKNRKFDRGHHHCSKKRVYYNTPCLSAVSQSDCLGPHVITKSNYIQSNEILFDTEFEDVSNCPSVLTCFPLACSMVHCGGAPPLTAPKQKFFALFPSHHPGYWLFKLYSPPLFSAICCHIENWCNPTHTSKEN